MKTVKTDICVIGAGSGGLTMAAGAAKLGAKVVLIENDKMGGECLNTGCVPSKSLITSAHIADIVKNSNHQKRQNTRRFDSGTKC